mmetsp:Transcript_12488/g.16391  ORF Transcript_12488/g.16391 Transcript_12488/m.16391 type:complete len:683 (+) Transcript_12488:100-2148(+)
MESISEKLSQISPLRLCGMIIICIYALGFIVYTKNRNKEPKAKKQKKHALSSNGHNKSSKYTRGSTAGYDGGDEDTEDSEQKTVAKLTAWEAYKVARATTMRNLLVVTLVLLALLVGYEVFSEESTLLAQSMKSNGNGKTMESSASKVFIAVNESSQKVIIKNASISEAGGISKASVNFQEESAGAIEVDDVDDEGAFEVVEIQEEQEMLEINEIEVIDVQQEMMITSVDSDGDVEISDEKLEILTDAAGSADVFDEKVDIFTDAAGSAEISNEEVDILTDASGDFEMTDTKEYISVDVEEGTVEVLEEKVEVEVNASGNVTITEEKIDVMVDETGNIEATKEITEIEVDVDGNVVNIIDDIVQASTDSEGNVAAFEEVTEVAANLGDVDIVDERIEIIENTSGQINIEDGMVETPLDAAGDIDVVEDMFEATLDSEGKIDLTEDTMEVEVGLSETGETHADVIEDSVKVDASEGKATFTEESFETEIKATENSEGVAEIEEQFTVTETFVEAETENLDQTTPITENTAAHSENRNNFTTLTFLDQGTELDIYSYLVNDCGEDDAQEVCEKHALYIAYDGDLRFSQISPPDSETLLWSSHSSRMRKNLIDRIFRKKKELGDCADCTLSMDKQGRLVLTENKKRLWKSKKPRGRKLPGEYIAKITSTGNLVITKNEETQLVII